LPVSFISCASKRVDNLGAYSIPSETGLLIPSGYNNQRIQRPFFKLGHICAFGAFQVAFLGSLAQLWW
jgi:hypothetical protein